ncbi:hypothetical protein M422DRAFT_244081 [Sphaerobolus stellatus SS14]|nr:hypothetical protein M422DRAFT_244081 [Sphaerobolus stellatus SS14]
MLDVRLLGELKGESYDASLNEEGKIAATKKSNTMYLHNMDLCSILGIYYPEPANPGNTKEYTLHMDGQEAGVTPKFSIFIAIPALQEILYRDVANMSREDWQPSAHDKYPAIDMSSSYFTKSRHNSPTEFSDIIDPCGELASQATAQNLVRHPDFLKEFCKHKIIESNRKTILEYQTINPATIQKGQLVEVCIEFKAILTKHAKWKTIVIPRAIVILR